MHPRFSVKSSFKGNEIDASDGRYATKAGKQQLKAPRGLTCNGPAVNASVVPAQKPTPVAAATVPPQRAVKNVPIQAKAQPAKTVQVPQQQQKIVAKPARAVQAAPKGVAQVPQPKSQVKAPRAQAQAAQAQSIRVKTPVAQPKIEVQAPQCGARTVQVPQKPKIVAQPQILRNQVSRPRHQVAPLQPQSRVPVKPAQQPTVQDRNYWKGGQVVQGIAQPNDPATRQREAAREIAIQKHARRGVRQEAPQQIRQETMTINVPASALEQDEFILELPQGVNMDNVTINVEAALDEVEEVEKIEEPAIQVPVNGRHREAFKVAPPSQKDTRDFAAIEKERAAEERAHYRSKNIVASAAPLPAKSNRFAPKNN